MENKSFKSFVSETTLDISEQTYTELGATYKETYGTIVQDNNINHLYVGGFSHFKKDKSKNIEFARRKSADSIKQYFTRGLITTNFSGHGLGSFEGTALTDRGTAFSPRQLNALLFNIDHHLAVYGGEFHYNTTTGKFTGEVFTD